MQARTLFLFPALVAILVAIFAVASGAKAEEKYKEDGKYYTTADDMPTYNIQADGTVDWFTYSGFRRYHSECHVCHGPEGLGSTYAPSLVDSLKTMSYEEFMDILTNGRERVTPGGEISKMPAFGENVNAICYSDDLYVYLKARSDGVLPRGRPRKREDKLAVVREDEAACQGNG